MLDYILVAILVVVLPARALWRSRKSHRPQETKATRYATTIGLVVGLLSLLAVNWVVSGRNLAMLGLGPPVTLAALTGLALAMALLVFMSLLVRRKAATASPDAERLRREQLPDTPTEIRLFVVMAFSAGIGWEILYRGFLLFYLEPVIGAPAAVAVAAAAYGAAHGFKDWRQFMASMIAALAFVVGYMLTQSLWWLMLLHTGLPLLALLSRSSAPSAS